MHFNQEFKTTNILALTLSSGESFQWIDYLNFLLQMWGKRDNEILK